MPGRGFESGQFDQGVGFAILPLGQRDGRPVLGSPGGPQGPIGGHLGREHHRGEAGEGGSHELSLSFRPLPRTEEDREPEYFEPAPRTPRPNNLPWLASPINCSKSKFIPGSA